MYSCYAASFVILAVGLGFKPDTSIKSWARGEAEARNERLDAGLEVEYGVHYSLPDAKYAFTQEAVGSMPVVPELGEE